MNGVIYFDLEPTESRMIPLVNPLGYLFAAGNANISYLRGIKLIDVAVAGTTNLSVNGDISTTHSAGSAQFTQTNTGSQTWSNLFIGGDPKGRIQRFSLSYGESVSLTMNSDIGFLVLKDRRDSESWADYKITTVSKNYAGDYAIWSGDPGYITKSSGSRDFTVTANEEINGFLIS